MKLSAELTELKLINFKGFRDQTLPLRDATILIGRNSAGKSNALDALETLNRLASGESIIEALDGSKRDSGGIRGGSFGLVPHGSSTFSLGCTVAMDGYLHRYTIEIEVSPGRNPRVVYEKLIGPGFSTKSQKWSPDKVLFSTRTPENGTGSIEADYYNGNRGTNPRERFADNIILLKQFIDRFQYDKRKGVASAVRGAQAVRFALRAIFHLDPVPYLMRDYVRDRPFHMYRTGENISAVFKELQNTSPDIFGRIQELTREIVDDNIAGIDFVKTEMGEIMLALKDQDYLTPAREMSDGLLRFLAIAATLLPQSTTLDIETPSAYKTNESDEVVTGGVLTVIEELENGVHPSQASRLLSMVEESGQRENFKVLVTTHSPALLDAAEGRLNDSIIVCYRDPDSGFSILKPVVDFPGYEQVMASQTLGKAVTKDEFRDSEESVQNFASLNELLGIA